MRRYHFKLALACLLLVCLAGCVTPTPTPTPEAAASATATPSPVPPALTPTPDATYSLVRMIDTDGVIGDVAWSPDSTALVISGMFGYLDGIALYQLNAEGPKWIVETGPVTAVAFSSDGRYVVCLTANGILTVLDAETGTIIQETKDGADCNVRTFPLVVLTDGDNVYTASTDYVRASTPFPSELDVWDMKAETCERITSTDGWVDSAYLNKNGYFLINYKFTGSQQNESEIQVWNTKSKIQVCSIMGSDCVKGTLNPVRNEMVIVCKGGMELWDVETCTIQQRFPVVNFWPQAFDPTGHILVVSDNHGTIIFWNMDTDTVLFEIPNPDGTSRVQFDPSGSYITSANSSSILKIWQVEFQGAGAD